MFKNYIIINKNGFYDVRSEYVQFNLSIRYTNQLMKKFYFSLKKLRSDLFCA